MINHTSSNFRSGVLATNLLEVVGQAIDANGLRGSAAEDCNGHGLLVDVESQMMGARW